MPCANIVINIQLQQNRSFSNYAFQMLCLQAVYPHQSPWSQFSHIIDLFPTPTRRKTCMHKPTKIAGMFHAKTLINLGAGANQWNEMGSIECCCCQWTEMAQVPRGLFVIFVICPIPFKSVFISDQASTSSTSAHTEHHIAHGPVCK